MQIARNFGKVERMCCGVRSWSHRRWAIAGLACAMLNPLGVANTLRPDATAQMEHSIREPFFNAETIIRLITEAGGAPTGEPIKVTVGDFNYAGTELQSPFSSALASDLEHELKQSPGIELVPREELTETQRNKTPDSSDPLQPGSAIPADPSGKPMSIVRGRFFPSENGVKIAAEIALLNDGTIRETTVEIPHHSLPQSLGAESAGSGIEPANLDQSLDSIRQVVTNQLDAVPSDFPVELRTIQGKRAYIEGETIGFRIRSAEDCHLTVLCHQSNGDSVVLFPNRWQMDTFVRALDVIEIPSPSDDFRMRIGPPFGSDIVEVIACSSASSIHQQLARQAPTPTTTSPFHITTRGIIVEGIDAALAAPSVDNASQKRWGRAHIVVSTFPRD
jgi:hypothetical protein